MVKCIIKDNMIQSCYSRLQQSAEKRAREERSKLVLQIPFQPTEVRSPLKIKWLVNIARNGFSLRC